MGLGDADQPRMGTEESMNWHGSVVLGTAVAHARELSLAAKTCAVKFFSKKMIKNTGRQVRSDEEKNNGQ